MGLFPLFKIFFDWRDCIDGQTLIWPTLHISGYPEHSHKRGRSFFALLLAVMLSGCMQATASWTKPGASASDIERAQLECKFEAAKSEPPRMLNAPTWDSELRQSSLIDLCLRAKGFVR